jgi:hypothetical protein
MRKRLSIATIQMRREGPRSAPARTLSLAYLLAVTLREALGGQVVLYMGLALRFGVNAAPSGLHRSSLQASPVMRRG